MICSNKTISRYWIDIKDSDFIKNYSCLNGSLVKLSIDWHVELYITNPLVDSCLWEKLYKVINRYMGTIWAARNGSNSWFRHNLGGLLPCRSMQWLGLRDNGGALDSCCAPSLHSHPFSLGLLCWLPHGWYSFLPTTFYHKILPFSLIILLVLY